MLARSDWLIICMMMLAVILAVCGLGWFEASLECASATSPDVVAAQAHV